MFSRTDIRQILQVLITQQDGGREEDLTLGLRASISLFGLFNVFLQDAKDIFPSLSGSKGFLTE